MLLTVLERERVHVGLRHGWFYEITVREIERETWEELPGEVVDEGWKVVQVSDEVQVSFVREGVVDG